MSSHDDCPTGYSSCWVPGNITSYPIYHLHSHELNKGELVSKILLDDLEHITKKGRMCVIMISYSLLGLMGSQAKWNTILHDNDDGYKRPSFRWKSLLPSILSIILCSIRNHQLSWDCDYYEQFVDIRCRQTDLRQRHLIWLQQVGCLADNNAQMTTWEHQIIMLEIYQAKTVKLGNPRSNLIDQHRGIVTLLRSQHL